MDSGTSSRIVVRFVITCAAFFLGACGAGLSGTCSNPTGLVTLDLRSGGRLPLAMMGEDERALTTPTERT